MRKKKQKKGKKKGAIRRGVPKNIDAC